MRIKYYYIFILLFIFINATLEYFKIDTGLSNFKEWLVFAPSDRDSWHPMMLAINYLREHHDMLVYDKLFFLDHVKFQYPLTSLLPLDFLNITFAYKRAILIVEAASWLAVPATAIISTLSFTLVMQKNDLFKNYDQVLIGVVTFFAILLYSPILMAYTLGQVQVFINLFFAVACFLWICDRKIVAGFFMGLICVIKPHFILFLVWSILRKQWRFVSGIIIVVLVFSILSWLIYGFDNNINYLKVASYMSKHGETYYPNQSMNGLLNRMLFNGNNLNWSANSFAPFNPVVYAITALSSIIFIAFSLFYGLKIFKNNMLLDFVIAGTIFTISSPIAWMHHYGVLPQLLIILFAFLINGYAIYNKKYYIALAIIYFLSAGFYPFINITSHTLLNFTQSYHYFSGISAIVLGCIMNKKRFESV